MIQIVLKVGLDFKITNTIVGALGIVSDGGVLINVCAIARYGEETVIIGYWRDVDSSKKKN